MNVFLVPNFKRIALINKSYVDGKPNGDGVLYFTFSERPLPGAG